MYGYIKFVPQFIEKLNKKTLNDEKEAEEALFTFSTG